MRVAKKSSGASLQPMLDNPTTPIDPASPPKPSPGALFDLGFESAPGTSQRTWQPPSVEELRLALPQYEIIEFLARGGMGAVYKGMQSTLRRAVAIKVLPPEIEDGDMQFAARFKHEAQAMAQLSHPHIVAVFDAGETANGLLYFVMEYIEGTDVAQIIASEGQLDPLRAINITVAVCEALAFAHEEGIIHRDIKPSNIMLDKRGRVKVADFGLAKTVNVESTLMTGSNVAMGTPDFIAPETLIAGTKVDQRADIYAVGVMLYQMLTGKIPRGRFELPSGVVPQVDKAFDAIVDKAMQTDRDKRYSSAAEMKTAVESVAMPRGSGSQPPSSPAKALADRRSLKPPALITAGIAVLASLLWFAFGKKDPQPAAFAGAAPPAAREPQWESFDFAKMDEAAMNAGQTKKLGKEGTMLRVRDYNNWKKPSFQPRNVAMRTTVHFGTDTSDFRLFFRSIGTAVAPYVRLYAFSVEICTSETDAGKILKRISLPAPYKPGDDAVLQAAMIGSQMHVWLDGRPLCSAEVPGFDRQGVASVAAKSALVKNLDYLTLDGIPETEALKLAGVAPTPAVWAPLPAAVEARAIKLWDSPEKLPQAKGVTWENGTIHLDGASSSVGPESRDAILRAAIRANPGSAAVLVLRTVSSDRDHLRLSFHLEKQTLALRTSLTGAHLAEWPLSRDYADTEWLHVELRAIGDEFTVLVEGKLIGTARSDALRSQGKAMIYAGAAGGYFRDVTYYTLDGLPEAEALKLAGLPSGTTSPSPTPQVSASSAPTFGGHRYQVFSASIPWLEAKAKAEALGGHLATLTSKEEADFVHELCRQALPQRPFQAWLGGIRGRGPGPEWKWITDEPFTYEGAWNEGHAEAERVGDPRYLTVSRRGDTREDVRAWNQMLQVIGAEALAHLGGYVVEWEAPAPISPRPPASTSPESATKDAPFMNSLGMKFVPVPITGATGGQRLLFSVWETRVQDYELFCRATQREYIAPDFPQGPTHPAVNTSWEHAMAFCDWLTQRERKVGFLGPNESYRLPTDHEWSCAAGIGDQEDAAEMPEKKTGSLPGVYFWGRQWPPPEGAGNFGGEEFAAAVAAGKYERLGIKGGSREFRDDFAETSPVGSFAPNAFGLHDLGGNVEEWCDGWTNGERMTRVSRDGGWTAYLKQGLSSTIRHPQAAAATRSWLGFRIVLAPTMPSSAR